MLIRLLSILFGAFLGALDTDLFQIDQNIFYKFLPFKPSHLVDFSKYGIEVLIFLVGLMYVRTFVKNGYLLALASLTGLAYISAVINIERTGGIPSAVFGNELRQLWVCVLGTGVFVRFADRPELKAGLNAFALVNAMKCMVLIANYFFGQRVTVLGVQTMVWDFTFLFTQIAVVLLTCSALLTKETPKKSRLYYMLLCTLSVIVILGSFRRLAAVYTLIGTGLTFLIHGRQERKTIKYVGFGLGTLLAVSIAGAGIYICLFGQAETMTRLESVLHWQEKSAYSTSNEMYADDWRVARQLILAHPILGIAFGKDYPANRVTEEERGETEQYIPLHVGLADYWVRMGIPFALLHILMLGIVLRAAVVKPLRAPGPLCAGALAMSLILLTLPFAPAFILDIKLSIMFTFCFAYAFRKATSDSVDSTGYSYAEGYSYAR
jgi:hypothetical protein